MHTPTTGRPWDARVPLQASWSQLMALLWQRTQESREERSRRAVRLQAMRAVGVPGA